MVQFFENILHYCFQELCYSSHSKIVLTKKWNHSRNSTTFFEHKTVFKHSITRIHLDLSKECPTVFKEYIQYHFKRILHPFRDFRWRQDSFNLPLHLLQNAALPCSQRNAPPLPQQFQFVNFSVFGFWFFREDFWQKRRFWRDVSLDWQPVANLSRSTRNWKTGCLGQVLAKRKT